jgi:hypothetical protein
MGLVAAGTLVGAASLVLASTILASGTDASRDPGPSAKGKLALKASPPGMIVSAKNMAPGDQANGSVRIANVGTLVARDSLVVTGRGTLLSELRLRLYRRRDGGRLAVVYTGPALTRPIALGRIAPGKVQRYYVHVTLPRRAGNSFQGRHATVTFRWSAVAARP